MFHILGILFIFIIAVLVIGLSIIATLVRKIFGFGSRPQSYNNSNNKQSYSFNDSPNTKQAEKASEETMPYKHKKRFSKDEGEYVDFEEVGDKSEE